MVIALFEHKLRADIDTAEWEQTVGRMVRRAVEMPGFVSVNGYKAADGTGLAVVRFVSEDALDLWEAHPEHRVIQARGREAFFDYYKTTVATEVVRESDWTRSVLGPGQRRGVVPDVSKLGG